MRKFVFLATFAGAAALAAAAPSAADPLDQPLPDEELADMRGGFVTADGLEIGLGAVVRTLVDGQLALESTITWTADGPTVTRALSGDTTQADAASLHEAAVNRGLDLEALAGQDDVFFLGGDGTAVIHRIDDHSLRNLVLNVENNLDIRQEIDVTLTLPDFQTMQREIGDSLAGLRIGRDLDAASVGALGG